MRLVKWMTITKNSPATIAAQLNCSVWAVYKWLGGLRTPRPLHQSRIRHMTNGMVGEEDWED